MVAVFRVSAGSRTATYPCTDKGRCTRDRLGSGRPVTWPSSSENGAERTPATGADPPGMAADGPERRADAPRQGRPPKRETGSLVRPEGQRDGLGGMGLARAVLPC